jgi:hypothetical protein
MMKLGIAILLTHDHLKMAWLVVKPGHSQNYLAGDSQCLKVALRLP